MKHFIVTQSTITPPIYQASNKVEAVKVCFNSGWVLFYGSFDRIVLALPAWRVISVAEMETSENAPRT